jgi:hypothetical protein
MSNPLNGVRVKIDRAKKHLAELQIAIQVFEAREPYHVTMDADLETYRFREREAIPDEWGAIVGDCKISESGVDVLHRLIVDVCNRERAKVVDGVIVRECSFFPTAALIAVPSITVAIVDPAVEADLLCPVAAVKSIAAFERFRIPEQDATTDPKLFISVIEREGSDRLQTRDEVCAAKDFFSAVCR